MACYQRKSPGRRDAHARVAGHLAAPLPADDAGVLRRPRRPGAAGLRLGPGEREARELRGDVYVGVALRRIATLALEVIFVSTASFRALFSSSIISLLVWSLQQSVDVSSTACWLARSSKNK